MKIERLVAAFIDNMCVAFCCSPLFLLALNIRSVWATALLGAGYVTLLLLKDISPLSIGKRLMKFEICSASTGESATVKQRILRNITLFVWPVEVVVLLLSSDDRRLTDKMFGTVVKRK
jgi:uncharacterized RDD family membrane protein YckC